MNIRSAKAKGRRLSSTVREMLLEYAPDLPPQDIAVTPSSVNGPDLTMSYAAQKVYPYSVEVKNQESIQIWNAYKQAQDNQLPDTYPLLVFSRNNADVMCCLKFEDFLRLTR